MTVNDTELRIEQLEEALADATRILAAEDVGWGAIGSDDGSAEAVREHVRAVRPRARLASVSDPLVKRGLGLRVAYVWGDGVSVTSPQEDPDEQDVNAVVQDFLDREAGTFSGSQACEERERLLGTEGELYHALFTAPVTGVVRVRRVPSDQIADVITDPEDVATPWFYRRTWSERVVTDNGISTSTTTRQRTALYPDINYRPARRPRSIDGWEIYWDAPIVHTAVNRIGTAPYGVPDLLAALPWAVGYRTFLGDWAKLMRSLSQFAWRATAKNQRGAGQIRAKLPTGGDDAGRTVVTGEGQTFEAINKGGASIDANSGRPLAAMIAAALDVPVTMLLADPGVTGARATAETLDEPMRLSYQLRRNVHSDTYRAVLNHVVREAVRAPQGPLRGTIRRDPSTGQEVVELLGKQDWSLRIDWPDLSKNSMASVVTSTIESKTAGLLPPLTAAMLVGSALGVDDVDAMLDELTGDDGGYLDPTTRAGDAAAAQARRLLDAGGSPDAPVSSDPFAREPE